MEVLRFFVTRSMGFFNKLGFIAFGKERNFYFALGLSVA